MPSLNYYKIQERLFTRPHLIHPAYLSSILGGLGGRLGIELDVVNPVQFASVAHSDEIEMDVSVPGSIALIQVHGALVQRGGWMEGCGIRSYDAIREDLEEALANVNVSAILLDIDSGGGECAGLFDLCDWIMAQGEKKPIYAFAHDYAFSAAYAIACTARKLYVAQTGEVGSVGVVCAHVDQSGANSKAGIVITPIYAGDKKVDGWSHAPLSDSAKADYQHSIDATYQKFVSLVAKGRGISEQSVRDTEAGCFIPSDAMRLGLVDAVSSFDGVIEEIFAEIGSANKGSGPSAQKNAANHGKEKVMPMKLFGLGKRAENSPADTEEDDVEAVDAESTEDDDENCAEPEKPLDEDQEDKTDSDGSEEEDEEEPEEGDVIAEARQAGYAEALAVVEITALAGHSVKSAVKLLQKGATAETARSHFLTLQKTSAKTDVLGQHQGQSGDGADRMAGLMRKTLGKKGN